MNIFFLAFDPAEAAIFHCDKHVVKMVLESAQMLSTAHRMLNGVATLVTVPNGRRRQLYLLPGEKPRFELRVIDKETGLKGWVLVIDNSLCYSATHAGHPCSKWVLESTANYHWLYRLMIELDKERQHRFTPGPGKTIRELSDFLSRPPAGLGKSGMTPPAQAMPVECKREDPVEAYRAYYNEHKQHIAAWSKRQVPTWFTGGLWVVGSP